MVCERCGSEIADNSTICSVCGTVQTARNVPPAHTSYGAYPQYSSEEALPYQREQHPPTYAVPSQSYQAAPSSRPGSYAPPYQTAKAYQRRGPNPPWTNGVTFSNKNSTALIAECIFSLIGLFGIGWLIAGETAVGLVLLLGSILVYWPIMIFGTILTLGFGLICLGPIAIAAIIVNILLLNSVLNRKTTSFTMRPPWMHTSSEPYRR
jgi:hypothetical protein